MSYITETNQVVVADTFDIIVAGGGVAGVAAALAARRCGRRVLLLEKSLSLGGLATLGLINLFVPLCNGRGVQIIRGMAQEFVELATKHGYDTIPEEWQKGQPEIGTMSRYITRFSPHIFSLVLARQLEEEGVTILLDTVVAKPLMEDRICRGVFVENKSGREFYACNILIDTTGDADILFRAGVPTIVGSNYFTYTAKAIDLDSCRAAVESGRIDKAIIKCHGGKATLYGDHQLDGARLYAGTTAEDVTEYVLANQRILLQNIAGDARFTREVVALPGMAQFRTTRRIDGAYTLTEADRYKHFADSIGAICDFDHRDFLYEVPYRCLYHKGFGNLLTAGRSAAARDYAWDVLRVIPPAIITGQAAGLAAVQALDTRQPIDNLDIARLQKSLSVADVMIHFDDRLIPDDREISEAVDVGHL